MNLEQRLQTPLLQRGVCFLGMVGIGLCALSAFAQPPGTRLDDLERKLTALEKTYLQNNEGVASAVARAEALQREAASFQGIIETNQHLIESERQEREKQLRDLDHRLSALEERLSIVATQISQALGKIDAKLADETSLYQKGLDKIQNGDALGAAGAFQVFLKKYGTSQFAANAQYWVGEAYFSLRDWQRAIKEFQVFTEKYPQHEKGASAILRQGMAFFELGMFDDASAFFEKIVATYPSRDEAVEAKSRLEKIAQKKAAPPASSSPETLGYPPQTIEQERSQTLTPPTPQPQSDPSVKF